MLEYTEYIKHIIYNIYNKVYKIIQNRQMLSYDLYDFNSKIIFFQQKHVENYVDLW